MCPINCSHASRGQSWLPAPSTGLWQIVMWLPYAPQPHFLTILSARIRAPYPALSTCVFASGYPLLTQGQILQSQAVHSERGYSFVFFFFMFLSLPSGNESLAWSLVSLLSVRYVNNCGTLLYEEAIKLGSLEVSIRQGGFWFHLLPSCTNSAS